MELVLYCIVVWTIAKYKRRVCFVQRWLDESNRFHPCLWIPLDDVFVQVNEVEDDNVDEVEDEEVGRGAEERHPNHYERS